MRWAGLTLVLVLPGLATIAGAHSDSGSDAEPIPNFMAGRDALEIMRESRRRATERRSANAVETRDAPAVGGEGASSLEKRQAGRCGPNFNNQVCEQGFCCSSAGWCGQGYLYCSAPSCQIEYGPACDANIRPSGPNTANVPRPKVGNVPYGTSVRRCTKPGDIALTFDDGPYSYTGDLLDKLKRYNAKATFYVTGNNLGKGKINDPNTAWPSLLRRMIAEGHQIASHTWSHQRLPTIAADKFQNQMIYNEIAIADLFGYFPTYMRPPYSACDSACETRLNDLGYHITYFDLDTEGYLKDSPSLIQGSKDIWDAAVEGGNPARDKWLHIEHDPVYQTVYNLTDYMLASLQRNGFRAVTVGECLNDPKENWYRTVTGGGSGTTTTTTGSTPTGTLPASTNGRCGPNHNQQTCAKEPGATCCSAAGWCGNTSDHCGTRCQPLYGNCQISPPKGTTTTGTTTTPTATGTARPTSTNGRCGPSHSNMTCAKEPLGATCCSRAGWCGSTTDHCGTGCQTGFGTCTS